MAYSGTVGLTQIDVATLLDHALRRCGLPSSVATPEIVDIAKDNLFFYLSNLANRGVNLWCVDREIVGFTPGQYTYHMDIGTIDVRTITLRRMSNAQPATAVSSAGGIAANAFDGDLDSVCTQVSPNGNISNSFGSALYVTSVAIRTNGDQAYDLVWEYSLDGVIWAEALSIGEEFYADNKWYWYDLPTSYSATYFRVRETGGGTLNVRELVFGFNPYEIVMARLNQDDYSNLPNKTFQGRPLQYWFDRQITPDIWVWPSPNNIYDHMVCWRHRQIMDVGTLRNTIEVPQRWIKALVDNLAAAMANELPDIPEERIARLMAIAEKSEMEAEIEDRDASPVYLSSNIAPYTR